MDDIPYSPQRVIEILVEQVADLTRTNAVLRSAVEVLSQQVGTDGARLPSPGGSD